MTAKKYAPNWDTLLKLALRESGKIADCYRFFHSYSFGNQLLAYSQAVHRKIELGPIATFNRWKQLKRHVKKNEKAVTLCRPYIMKIKSTPKGSESQNQDDEKEKSFLRVRFVYQNRWFFLSQTDGEPLELSSPPGWDIDRALNLLSIKRIDYTLIDGNVQGYADGRAIAINPIAGNPIKTALHEIAHIELGHTAKGAKVSRDIAELEAEGVAYLLGNSLNLEGAESSRAYLQNWYNKKEFPKQSAKNILVTASKILKAGQEQQGGFDALS